MYLKATIVSSLVDNLWDYMGKFICRCTLFNYLHIPGFFYLLSGFLYKGYFVSCFRIIYPIFYGMTFMLCWYVICLFILCGIILCFRQGSKVEQFHWLVIPCINIFEIKKIVAEVRQSGPWERAVDGRPWRAAGTDFWNKRHGFLSPIVAEVRQSGPWTAGRDGPPERTFETNGTDSWRRLLQKSVRAGRGSRPWTAGRDGPPGIDFWNKRHGFLAPIVSKVCQIGPWGAGRGRLAVTGIHLPDLDHARETPFQHNLHIKQCLRHYVQEAIFTWMTEKQTPQCYHR